MNKFNFFSRKWFRPDGSLAVLANPLHSYVSRNILDHPADQWKPVYLHVMAHYSRDQGINEMNPIFVHHQGIARGAQRSRIIGPHLPSAPVRS